MENLPLNIIIISLGVGFLLHMIGKYWSEDGTFASNFFTLRTLRYTVFTALTTASAVLVMKYGGPELSAIISLGAVSMASASASNAGQKIASKSKA